MIALAMSWTSYVEKSGSGTGEIIDKCRDHGLATPIYDPTEGFFKTIIWRNGYGPTAKRDPVKGPSQRAQSDGPCQRAQSKGTVSGPSQGPSRGPESRGPSQRGRVERAQSEGTVGDPSQGAQSGRSQDAECAFAVEERHIGTEGDCRGDKDSE